MPTSIVVPDYHSPNPIHTYTQWDVQVESMNQKSSVRNTKWRHNIKKKHLPNWCAKEGNVYSYMCTYQDTHVTTQLSQWKNKTSELYSANINVSIIINHHNILKVKYGGQMKCCMMIGGEGYCLIQYFKQVTDHSGDTVFNEKGFLQ